MDILYAALIFAGLSLDSFVMMMNQASRLADLHKKDILLYCTVFSLTASAAMLMGYGAAIPLKTVVADKNEQTLACLIILVTGLYILMKSLKNKAPEEKADREFNAGRCARPRSQSSPEGQRAHGCRGLWRIHPGRIHPRSFHCMHAPCGAYRR